MARKTPKMLDIVTAEWNGQDAFVIGGGSSLKGYDFSYLRGRKTLGANDAFRLGVETCGMILFGDDTWWQQVKFDLETYAKAGGRVYSIAPASERLLVPWLRVLKRVELGFGKDTHLGWNRSTGAAAINLAANLGAGRLFLLGFDMGPGANRRTHWHNVRRTVTPDTSFHRFELGFQTIAIAMNEHYPDLKIFNVNPESKLNHWQKITFADMERLVNERH